MAATTARSASVAGRKVTDTPTGLAEGAGPVQWRLRKMGAAASYAAVRDGTRAAVLGRPTIRVYNGRDQSTRRGIETWTWVYSPTFCSGFISARWRWAAWRSSDCR